MPPVHALIYTLYAILVLPPVRISQWNFAASVQAWLCACAYVHVTNMHIVLDCSYTIAIWARPMHASFEILNEGPRFCLSSFYQEDDDRV